MATSETTIEEFRELDGSTQDINSGMGSKVVQEVSRQTLQTQRDIFQYCMVKREPND